MGSSSWPRSTIKGVLIVKEEGGSSFWPRSTIKGVLLVEEEEQKAPLDSINRSGPVRLGQFSIDSFGTEGIVHFNVSKPPRSKHWWLLLHKTGFNETQRRLDTISEVVLKF